MTRKTAKASASVDPVVSDARQRPDRHAYAPSFEFSHDEAPGDVLLAGFANVGLAGLTAVDFLVEAREMTQTGHVTTDQLPAITPFEDGRPRHHTRLFADGDRDLSVLVGELFVPQFAADGFSQAVVDYIVENDVSEVAILAGVPIPHGPEDHRTFYVATADYGTERQQAADVPPMGRGFLDGVNAGLMARGIDSTLRVCVYVTPVHPQAPDVEAAIRLLDVASDVYELDVDTGPLEAYAGEVRQYYEELSQRLDAVADQQMPEDRMYM